MRAMNTRVLGLAVVLANSLGGCYAGYVADVRNQTPQPIYADLIVSHGPGNGENIGRERIGPGDRGAVASRKKIGTDQTVYVQVDSVGNPGYPAQLNLTPGTTVITVTQDGTAQNGKLRVDAVSRP